MNLSSTFNALLPLTLVLSLPAFCQETLPPDRTPPPRPARPGRTDVPMTPERELAAAVQRGDIEATTKLLAESPERLNSKTERTSLVYYAVRSRMGDDASRLAMLKFLLERGADPDWSGPNFVYTPLIEAIREGRTELAILLLQKDAQPNLADQRGFTPLQHAFQQEKPEIVTALISSGVDLSQWNSRGLTPLHIAASASGRDTATLELMLKKGADANAATREGTEKIASHLSPPGLRPLHLAAAGGNLPVINILLKNGADLGARSVAGDTPLHTAAQHANVAVQALLAAGADAKAKDTHGNTPLHLSLMLPPTNKSPNPFASEVRTDAMAALIAKSDLQARGQQGLTPLLLALQARDQEARDLLAPKSIGDDTSNLFDAAAQNDTARLAKLLQAKPHLATKVLPDGWTPLHMAARWNSSGTLAALVAAGADVNARDSQGASPLHRVMQSDEADAAMRANILLLLEKGADVNAKSDYEPYAARGNGWKDGFGDTPLNRAIQLGDEELTALMLKHGARVDARNRHRDTPLMIAVKLGRSKLVPLLLEAGAEVDAEDQVRSSPLERALRSGQEEIARLLIGKGADVNHRSHNTPLIWAVRSGNLELVQLLVAQGADVNARNDRGETALSGFGRQASEEIREFLKKSGAVETTMAPARAETPPIIMAAQNGDVAKLRELLADATLVNAVDSIGDTPLHKLLLNSSASFSAAKPEMVALLLEKGADLQARNRHGSTPLHYAARTYSENSDEIVNLLLAKNADIKARDHDGNTPLHNVNNFNAARALLAGGAEIDAENAYGSTPLHHAAVANGSVETVKVLLEAGAKPNVRNGTGDLPVHLHLRRRGYAAEPLLLEKSDLTQRDSLGLSAVQAVLLRGEAEMLTALLAREPKVDAATEFLLTVARSDVDSQKAQLQKAPHLLEMRLPGGETPLHISARWLALESTQFLLSEKADVNARDADARTPLHDISRWRGSENQAKVRSIAEALLAAGADPNAMSLTGHTPLHQSLSTNDKELILTLLNGDANPNIHSGRRKTALHMAVSDVAVRQFAAELIPLLVAKGADINALGNSGNGDSRGTSPLGLAVQNASSFSEWDASVITALLQNKARLDVQNDDGDNVFHLAARRGKLDLLKHLLDASDQSRTAALSTRNLKGHTPLGAALAAKRTEAAQLLRAS